MQIDAPVALWRRRRKQTRGRVNVEETASAAQLSLGPLQRAAAASAPAAPAAAAPATQPSSAATAATAAAGGAAAAGGNVQAVKPFEGILTFSVIEKEMDWGLLFLLGSGFVIASVSHVCGLELVLVNNMNFLTQQSKAIQVACIMLIAALITQITSNTATASIIMPLLSTTAKGLQGNPLLLMLAANVRTYTQL